MKILCGFFCITLALSHSTGAADMNQAFVFFGTYTVGTQSHGIYVSRFDADNGKLSAPELAAETANPSFIAIHPNQRFLYAVGELGGGAKSGAVNAFAINPVTGKLTPLNQQSSGGAGPCYVGVDDAGRHALVANYGGGSVTVLPIAPDGTLGTATAFMQHSGSSINPQRQKGPHAHSIFLDAANRFAFVPDLGLDKVLSYRFGSAKGTLAPNNPPFAAVAPGSGPRHLAFHPNGQLAYVVNEMACTITAFDYNAERGALTELQTISTLPKGATVQPSYSCAEVRVHPSGNFLYASNRGHNSITVFAIDRNSGKLTYVDNQPSQGKTPRNFNLDPTGAFLLAAHQNSDNVVVFRVNPADGKLTPTGQQIKVDACVCVKFMPTK